MTNFEGSQQIGWRLAIDKEKNPDSTLQLTTMQRLGALAERAAAARVLLMVGAHVTSRVVDPESLPEVMRTATPLGRRWELVTVTPERQLSPVEMAYARNQYGSAFQEALQPYAAARTLIRLELTVDDIRHEQSTFYDAPSTYSGAPIWTPTPEVLATPEPVTP